MYRILHFGSKFWRLIGLSLSGSHCYGSLRDRCKAFLLRVAATRPGRRVFGGRVYSLNLRGLGEPIYVRSGTSDFLVVSEIFEQGAYRSAETFDRFTDSILIDLGANIGLSTRYFASLFPAARIIVVEPDRANRELLELNCRSLIEAKRLTIMEAFVAATDGRAGIDRRNDSWAYRKIEPIHSTDESIECVSLTTLLERNRIEKIHVLKCDIEGAEAELFDGANAWINKVRYLIVETHAPYSLAALYGDLRKAGWEFKVLRESNGVEVSQCFLERLPPDN
jgi:FkbM family methyltransferase